MSELGYTYPQWHKALRDLSDALVLTREQHETLSAWFKQHMFEIGCDFRVDIEAADRMKSDQLKEMVQHKQANEIARELIKHGLFIQETSYGNFGQPLYKNFRTSLLIFGAPIATVPAKRGQL